MTNPTATGVFNSAYRDFGTRFQSPRAAWLVGLICVTLLFAGCAGVSRQPDQKTVPQDVDTYLDKLDQIVQDHDAGDARYFPVKGFPYLRCDRFLEAMKTRLDRVDQKGHWLEQMQSADLASRRKEIGNLPLAALRELSAQTGVPPNPEDHYQTAVQSSNRMMEMGRGQEGYEKRVMDATVVADEYSTAMRVFLLYPIAALPVSIGTSNALAKIRQWHNTPPDQLTVSGRLTRYIPMESTAAFEPAELERLFAQENKDVFGLPQWTDDDVLKIAGMFAPVITQDVAADYDRFGAVHWKDGRVAIEYGRPVVYYYVSHAFVDKRPVVQMNYAVWYSERAGENAPAIERGPLDGLTFRLTFNGDGLVIMADSMNSCGCSHLFIPAKSVIEDVVPQAFDFEPLVPGWLPGRIPENRVDLRVSSGWHQLQHVGVREGVDETIAYDLLPYEVLESLPTGNGRRASVFDPDGIMKDSWRVEPFIFFSMGIPKVGYMRQRGHHATKLIGREHFTNPDLFDLNFIFNLK